MFVGPSLDAQNFRVEAKGGTVLNSVVFFVSRKASSLSVTPQCKVTLES